MNRREFGTLLPALMAGLALTETASAAELKELTSGGYKQGTLKPTPQKGRTSGPILSAGMLKAGNIRLESHYTSIEPGSEHEAVGTHLHSEMWLVTEGTLELNLNGTPHLLKAGDVGLCVAGDKHFVANAGDTRVSYFVVTVGPPE
ncbi:cupin domain-containing protein [Terriglobus tenax]|uniref:cupin domain-containing protein n=1 Tax=Terriglobus tenax TaxID=1111115 RepID=UPI0021E002CB|nr:cupin domain-containing protein [Terriglobus tenax]